MSRKKGCRAFIIILALALALSGCGKQYEHPAVLPFGDSDWQSMNAEEIKSALQDAGFFNIEEVLKDTADPDKVGKATKLTVDGDNLFRKGTKLEGSVPVQITYYALKQFEPSLDVGVEGDEGWPEFLISTNLPAGTKLSLTLSNADGYTAQQTVSVSEGKAKSKKFTDENGWLPLAEEYTLLIEMRMSDQGATPKHELGENGECLTGALVVTESETGQKYVSMEYGYTSPYTKIQIDREKNKKSIYEIIEIASLSLAGNYGTNYKVSEDDGVLNVSVWNDGVAAGAMMAAQGNKETLEAWDSMRDSIIELSESIRTLLDENGHRATSSTVSVLNEVSRDKSVLIVQDGYVVYDYVYGIDMLGVGN